MQRSIAILIFFIVFIFFILIAYYGAFLTLWSSFILSLLISLIIMNIFYPPSQIPIDVADYTLILYALIEIIGIFLLAIYIIHATFCDVRTSCLCI